jgi:hypothetical protein
MGYRKPAVCVATNPSIIDFIEETGIENRISSS